MNQTAHGVAKRWWHRRVFAIRGRCRDASTSSSLVVVLVVASCFRLSVEANSALKRWANESGQNAAARRCQVVLQ